MKYIFDTSSLSVIFHHYYPSRFPSFWKSFSASVSQGEVVSVREAKYELLEKFEQSDLDLVENCNGNFFEDPSFVEMGFVKQIYSVPNFRQNLDKRKLMKGGPFADPFIVAKAQVYGVSVVTQEELKANAARIPNICAHFGILCINLEEFLAKEGWSF